MLQHSMRIKKNFKIGKNPKRIAKGKTIGTK